MVLSRVADEKRNSKNEIREAMYRDEYRDRRDDLSRDLDSSRYLPPPRDLYFDDRTRDRSYSDYDDLDRKRYGPPMALDEPYYRHHMDDLEPPPRGRGRTGPADSLPPLPHSLPSLEEPMQDLTTGVVVCGSVMVIPTSPFEKKPSLRQKHASCRTVFVGSLPDNATSKHLQDLFEGCGKVLDIRIAKGRNFGHVQFELVEDVDRAILLSGCRIRVGPSTSVSDLTKIHVDYAQPRSDSEIQKRLESAEPLTYNSTNAGMISAELHGEDTFWLAAKHIKTWIEKGNCNASTTNTFFGLISSCNTHSRKVAKKMKDLELEEEEWAASRRKKYERLMKESGVVEDVLAAACTQKSAWDSFTKPQRKSISQWKECASALSIEMQASLDTSKDGHVEPATKKVKVTTPEQSTGGYEAAMEAMKSEHAMALRKKETQIMQLNTLITQFKQRFPDEWENLIGGEGVSPEKGNGKKDATGDEPMESTGSLAANAAAYAKLRSMLGSTDDTKASEFSESEVAIITVLSTFLTVNPLGATVDEIAAYFRKYNPTVTSVYLESLLCRLPQVFQLSQQSSDEEKKWWFLGFQTCCTQGQYAMQEASQSDSNDVITTPTTSSQ